VLLQHCVLPNKINRLVIVVLYYCNIVYKHASCYCVKLIIISVVRINSCWRKAWFYSCLQKYRTHAIRRAVDCLDWHAAQLLTLNKAKTIPRMVFRLLEALAKRSRKLMQIKTLWQRATPFGLAMACDNLRPLWSSSNLHASDLMQVDASWLQYSFNLYGRTCKAGQKWIFGKLSWPCVYLRVCLATHRQSAYASWLF